jgi:hypothetical protein
VRFRDHVGDLVEGAADEIHELEFGDGAHAGERCSEGRANDGGFGDWGVDDALGAEAVDESVGDFEGAAVDADVFAEAEDGGIAVHFFPDSLADGFEVGEEHRVKIFRRGFAWIFADKSTSNALQLRFAYIPRRFPSLPWVYRTSV